MIENKKTSFSSDLRCFQPSKMIVYSIYIVFFELSLNNKENFT